MKIGIIGKEIPVYVSKKAPNEHICITGMSGSGKSTRIAEIIESAIQEKKTVVVLDLAGMDYKGLKDSNYISAKQDGIGLKLLQMTESMNEDIEYITDIFRNIFGLRSRQIGALRYAVQYAIENRIQFQTDLEAIDKGLKMQDSGVAEGVRNHLWGLVNSYCIRPSEKSFAKQEINIVTFAGLNTGTQKIAAEVVLSCLWKRIQNAEINDLVLVIDEFQNYIRKGSALIEMMREARKYGVSIILSTQTLEGFSATVMAAIKQSSVQMYFRANAADIKKLSEMIDATNADCWKMRLRQLKVGESVATGMLLVGNREIDDPIVIRSEYKENETSLVPLGETKKG